MGDRTTTVYIEASMSLDGFIAAPANSGFEHLFAWTNNGDVATESASARLSYRTSEASAAHVRHMIDTTGAVVVGRRLFDMTNGWDGTHPMGVPTFVVTHRAPDDWEPADTPFTFVTDGVSAAVDRAVDAAAGKDVGVGPGSVACQALDAGLVDEVRVDLVPVLLGGGNRMFDRLTNLPVRLGDPRIVEGTGGHPSDLRGGRPVLTIRRRGRSDSDGGNETRARTRPRCRCGTSQDLLHRPGRVRCGRGRAAGWPGMSSSVAGSMSAMGRSTIRE